MVTNGHGDLEVTVLGELTKFMRSGRLLKKAKDTNSGRVQHDPKNCNPMTKKCIGMHVHITPIPAAAAKPSQTSPSRE